MDKSRTRTQQGVHPGPLVFFRIAFGVLMLVEVGRYFAHGWIAESWIEPELAFKYWGFGWVHAWPGNGLYWHFAGLGLCAAGIALGFFYRLCAWGFFLGFTYVFLLDQATYLNHFYLIAWLSFWLACLSPQRWRSVDAWRAGMDPRRPAPAWWLTLLRIQLAAVYVFAGIAKLDADWRAGLSLGLWVDWPDASPWPGAGALLALAPIAMSWAGLLFDLLVVPALLWRPTRPAALVAALAFHGLNAWLFQIGIFPWLMMAATLLFLPCRAFAGFAPAVGDDRPIPRSGGDRRLALALTTVLALQLLVPLRHHLYPGDVTWTEEGHRFSWRMMLRDKRGTARFLVVDRARGTIEEVHPAEELEAWQADEMAVRPDMILQFAHHLARDRAAMHGPRPAVYARVSSTLNGRDRSLLIDPQVDLASMPRTLAPASWILPGPRAAGSSRPEVARGTGSEERIGVAAADAAGISGPFAHDSDCIE